MDQASGPFLTGSQSTVGEIPLPERESAITGGGSAQSPEGASPTPQILAEKPTPKPHSVGNRMEARKGTDPPPAPGPRSLPASGAARREPVNRVGPGLGQTSRLRRRAGVCKARHRILEARVNFWGLSTSPRPFQVCSPTSFPGVPTFLPLKFDPRGLLSLPDGCLAR